MAGSIGPANSTSTRLVGSPQAAWQPTITSIVANGGNSYTLTGTQLNGISAGASHGTGTEMDTNYPIIELHATDGSGQVYFARTSNWSSTGVATGSTPETTDFTLPSTMPYGTYSLTVVANGIASAPVSVYRRHRRSLRRPGRDQQRAHDSHEGDTVTYSLTVTNNGPFSAPNVVLSDTLDPNLAYVSATKSQGSFDPLGQRRDVLLRFARRGADRHGNSHCPGGRRW